ncbi:MAG: sel1 repeat family protein [Selenomonadaceae bacterium]|nr:sel1 repeat family protein [Selenomonadaceae bacterium]
MKMTREDKYRIKVLKKKISAGDLDAMMEYAQMYQNKFPEEVTPAVAKKMVRCYKTCMKAGNLTAALNLGAMYYGGEFIPRDFRKAVRYYKKATRSDDLETWLWAWTNLGYCYYYGRDIPVDDEKAFNCYMRAALRGGANALYKIGDMYRYGRYVAKDEQMAVLFYKRALREVHENHPVYPDIAKRIGECALYGIGMKKNIYKALNMLAKAEIKTYVKIKERDPFAASLLPKIKRMLAEARAQVEQDLGLNEKI